MTVTVKDRTTKVDIKEAQTWPAYSMLLTTYNVDELQFKVNELTISISTPFVLVHDGTNIRMQDEFKSGVVSSIYTIEEFSTESEMLARIKTLGLKEIS